MTPTEILMQEHRLIEQVLDCMEDAAFRLDENGVMPPDFFVKAAEFVTGFIDGSHHRNEEDILYVAMTMKDLPEDSGPVAVMLHEHAEGRRLSAAFRSAAERMQAGDSSAAMDVIHNVLDYVNLLRDHIIKEDNVLFPMADQLVTGNDMRVVSGQFKQALAEDEASGKIKYYQELALELSAALDTVEAYSIERLSELHL